ncbi:hypothetical protein C8T65DRAFT_699159 [Cerioporus squamosus]|nr:hypothetical protein C8T65DRAFT_699159 [Cerioporus squamosus]
MVRAMARKTRPTPTTAPIDTPAQAAKLRAESSRRKKALAAVKENLAPITEITPFVPFHPGDRVKVRVPEGDKTLWAEGFVTSFMNHSMMLKVDHTETDPRKAILVPVQFRAPGKARIWKRFRMCDIRLVERKKQKTV